MLDDGVVHMYHIYIACYLFVIQQEMMKIIYTEDSIENLKDTDISPGERIHFVNVFFKIPLQTIII